MTDKTAPCFSVCFSAVAVSEILLGSVKREKKDRRRNIQIHEINECKVCLCKNNMSINEQIQRSLTGCYSSPGCIMSNHSLTLCSVTIENMCE